MLHPLPLLQAIAPDDKFFLSGDEEVRASILGRRVKPGSKEDELHSPVTNTVEWHLLPLVSAEGQISLPRITVFSENYAREILSAEDIPKLFVRPPQES